MLKTTITGSLYIQPAHWDGKTTAIHEKYRSMSQEAWDLRNKLMLLRLFVCRSNAWISLKPAFNPKPCELKMSGNPKLVWRYVIDYLCNWKSWPQPQYMLDIIRINEQWITQIISEIALLLLSSKAFLSNHIGLLWLLKLLVTIMNWILASEKNTMMIFFSLQTLPIANNDFSEAGNYIVQSLFWFHLNKQQQDSFEDYDTFWVQKFCHQRQQNHRPTYSKKIFSWNKSPIHATQKSCCNE
jgi:hypothetical protein